MTDQPTLFAQMALRFGDHPENIAVEALGHILAHSTSARQGLEDVLRSGGSRMGHIARTETQFTVDGGSRPDLAGFDEAQEVRLFIEAKFWAGLTDDQPNGYLAQLPDDGSSTLLFVVPEARLEALWSEVYVLADQEYGLAPSTESGQLQSALIVDTECHLMMTSWGALLDRMAAHVGAAGDTRISGDIVQLRGLTERMDTDAFLPISSEELGPQIPRRVMNLTRLVNDATNRMIEVGWVDVTGLRVTPLETGYGRYIRLSEVFCRLGVNLEHWAHRGRTPLWLLLYNFNELGDPDSDRKEITRKLESMNVIDLGPGPNNGLLVPIELPTRVEYDRVLDCVSEQLEQIGSMISNGPLYG